MHFTVAGTPPRRIVHTAGLLVTEALPASVIAKTFLHMQTDLGVDIELFDVQAPLTFENLTNYVNRGDCDGTLFDRGVPGFVVQMVTSTSPITAIFR
jgi:Cyclophilin type peptidyl-prolyl cis-trans isomerase/CLD